MKSSKLKVIVLVAIILTALVLATVIALRCRTQEQAKEKAAAVEQSTNRVLRAIRPDTKPAKFPK